MRHRKKTQGPKKWLKFYQSLLSIFVVAVSRLPFLSFVPLASLYVWIAHLRGGGAKNVCNHSEQIRERGPVLAPALLLVVSILVVPPDREEKGIFCVSLLLLFFIRDRDRGGTRSTRPHKKERCVFVFLLG